MGSTDTANELCSIDSTTAIYWVRGRVGGLVRGGEEMHAPMKAMSRGRERDVALEYRAIARARSAGQAHTHRRHTHVRRKAHT